MQNLLDDLTELLQADQAFISDGAILKNTVIEAALSMDTRLLELLMQSGTIKAHFFTEVAGALVFDKVKFQDFVSNKAFLPDSYTAFKNRIGLTDGRDYLSQSRDVVLSWPYKDCVLEGGMTKEDKGRQEVFWNTTLAPDDITRLFEPKVLTRWERWDVEAVAKSKAKSVGEVSEEDNLLIKGNNLLALHSLKARYAGKVKLIYIDPPYNTGNDGFRYNDRFNHSAWLTFMRSRIEVARELLSRDGALFVSVDDNEGHYLKVLCDEIFGRDNFKCTFIWQKVDSPNDNKVAITPDHEFVLCYERVKEGAGFRQKVSEDLLNAYKVTEEETRHHRDRLLKKNGKASLRSDRESMFFEMRAPDGTVVFPIHDDGREARWSYGKEGVKRVEKEGRLIWKQDYETGNWKPYVREFAKEIPTRPYPSILLDVKTTRQAKAHLTTLQLDDAEFDTVKPEQLIERILEICTDPNDLVVDFFSGSGTTASVAHKMGRQWIAVEQMDYILDLPNSRLKKVIDGEQGGISKAVEWTGGGSFVYAELAASNSAYVGRIDVAQDIATLQTIHADIRATGYLRYDVDLIAFDTDDFAALSLEDAKRVLMDCLDANHLYVNLGSLGDKDLEISEDDTRATRSFYGITE